MSIKFKTLLFISTLILFVCIGQVAFAQNKPGEASDIQAMTKEIIKTKSFIIDKINLAPVNEVNVFSAMIKNNTDKEISIGVSLDTEPGLCLQRRSGQHLFKVAPKAQKNIEVKYEVENLTEGAVIRIKLGTAVKEKDDIDIKNVCFDKKYYIGKGNKSINVFFEKHSAKHFDIYYFKNSLAEKELGKIITDRELALNKISTLLKVKNTKKILLVFYPDAMTKTKQTGHEGAGFARGNLIVEIYSDKIKFDPFHETAHVILKNWGYPPALFDEGFAVYAAEKFGSDALKELGNPGKKFIEVTQNYIKEGKNIPLEQLFAYMEIGSAESKHEIAYPQAASVVGYLIDTYGIDKFCQVCKKLEETDEPAYINKNKELFKNIYGKSVGEIEKDWLENLKVK